MFTSVLVTLLFLSSPVFSAPGSGTATIVPDSDVTVESLGTWTIKYVALENFNSGGIDVEIPTGWTLPQTAAPTSGGYVTAYLEDLTSLSVSITGAGNRTISLSSLSLSNGDTVFVVYGDTSGGAGGAATAQTTAESSVEFTAISNPDGFASGEIASSPTLNVIAGPITSLVFTTSSQTITAGDESGVMRVRTEDVYGNPSPVPANQDITLSTTSGTGTFSHLPGGSWSETTSVTITSGTDTVSFYYLDTTSGTYSITASADGQVWPNAQQSVTVDVAEPYRLVVTPEDTTATAGDYVRFRLEVQDQFGNVSPVASDQTITLFQGGGIFYDKDDHGTQVTELVISSGSSSAEVDYRHTVMDTDQGHVLAFWDQDGVLVTADTKIYIDFATADTGVSELDGDKSTIIADDLDELEVTVTIRDAFGNPVSGSSVTLEATGTGNTIVDPGVTGADGTAIGYVRSTKAEAKIIRAYIGGTLQIVDTLEVDFVAGSFSLSESGISADPLTVTADGVDETDVTATVRDANGNPVSGRVIQLFMVSGTADIDQPGLATDADGKATGTVRSTLAESKEIGFRIDGMSADSTATVDFISGAASLSESGISADPLVETADGASEIDVTVTVRDAHGNPVSGQAVTLTASGSGNNIEDPAALTGSDGVAVGHISSTVAEIKTIGFEIGGAPADSTVDVEFVAGAASLSESGISAAPDTVTADGSDELDVTVTVRDANGNPVSGSAVTLEVDGSSNDITQPVGLTGSDGIATGTMTSTVAEEKTVSFRIDTNLADSTTAVQFVAGAVNLIESTISGDKNTVFANDGDALTVTVTARDQYGNPVQGRDVTLEINPDRAQNTVTQPGLTGADGTAVGYLYSTFAEEKIVRALIDGVYVTEQDTVLFVPDEADLAESEVVGDKSIITADGTDELTVTVTVKDQFGNPVVGAIVVMEADPVDGASYTQPAAPTGADGIAIGYVRSTVAEQKVVRALINGNPAVDTLIVDFIAGSFSLFESGISADPLTVTADDVDEVAVTVTVRDGSGNPVSGRVVQLEATGTGNDITQPAGVTGADGIAVGTVRSTVAEQKSISARIDGSLADSTVTVDFIAGPVNFTVSEVTGDTATVTADDVDELEVTVTVRDAYGNPVSGSNVTLEATGSGNGFTQPVGATGADGVATGRVRSTVAEIKTVSALIDASLAAETVPVTFVSGPASISESGIAAYPDTVIADGIDELEVTATVRDAYGNPVSGSDVTLEVIGTDNIITQPVSVTDVNGVAVGYVRSTHAEQKTVGFEIDSNPADSTGTSQFVAGIVDYFIITHDGSAVAGTEESVTIDVMDGNDNRLVSFDGIITIYTNTAETEDRIDWGIGTAAGSIVSQSGDTVNYQFDTADDGIATLGITDLTAESITIYASYGGVTSFSAAPLIVGHAVADSIFVISGGGQRAVVNTAVTAPLVVGVEDEYGNSVIGKTVTFGVLSGGGYIDTDLGTGGQQTTSSTDALGRAECEYWRLGTASGLDSDEVEATIPSGGTTSASFIATTDHDEIDSIVLTPLDRSVTVSTSIQVTATLTDQFGNLVVDEYVHIFISDTPDGTLSNDPSSPTNELNPTARAGTSDSTGTISVLYDAPPSADLVDVLDASHADLPASGVADVTYTSSATGATNLRVTVLSGATSRAGETFSFLVEAVDGYGNLDPTNTSHILLDPDPAGGFTFSESDWGATVTTADLVGGAVSLYGRGSDTGSWDIDVTDAASLLSDALFSIEITTNDTVDYYNVTAPASATAGSDFTVQADAFDRFGNLVTTANYGIDLRAVQAADPLQAASDVLNKTTGDITGGQYSESSMRYNTAENIRIEITDASSPVIGYSNAVTVNHAPAYQLVEISGDSTGVAAGDSVTLQARVLDVFGNPVLGQQVSFSVQEGGGGLAAAQRISNGAGEVTMRYATGTVAGENLVRAAILDADPEGLETQYFEITTVPRTDIAYVLLYLEGTSFQAGQSFGVDIEAYDEYDNLLDTDYSTELVPVAEQPSMTFVPVTVTLSAGTASFAATDILMGQNRITILSLGGDTLSAWSPYITIDHADAYKILYVAGDTTGVIAGDRTQIKARVRDFYDNNVNGEIVRFQITSNLGGIPGLIDGIGDPADGILITDAEGIAVCSLQTDINSGINNVEATIDDGNPPSEELVTFSVETMAGNISYYTVVPDGLLKTAGETFDVTIKAYDPFDNVAFGDDTTEVQLASDGAAEFSINPVTLSNGSAIVSVSDTVAQRLVVSAETLGGGAHSYSDTVTVLPDIPDGTIGIELVAPPTITATGTSISTITTLPITDQYGNIVSKGTRITVSALFGHVFSEDLDIFTAGVQRETGINGKISVFIMSDIDPGTDTITFESVEGSATGTATLIYAPKPDCDYAGFLDPGFVVPDSTAQFRCSVENTSTTTLLLEMTSTISFSDSLGNTYSAGLSAPVLLAGSSTITLEFEEAGVPGGMLGGTYTPSVFIDGGDAYGSKYSVRFNAGSNSVTVSSIKIVSITPYRTIVSRGDTVDVEVRLQNGSGNYVRIEDIDFSFSQSNSVVVGEWTPPLPDSLHPSSEHSYTGGVYILPQSPLGTDTIDASVTAEANGTEFRDFSADDAVGVWFIQSAARFAYVAGSLDPAAVSQLQSHAFSLLLRNDGEAVVTLDGALTTLFFTDGTNTFNVPLGYNLALSGSSTTGMTYTEAVIPAAMIPGSYPVDIHLVGSENGGAFDTTFTLSDQVTITSPAQVAYISETLDPTTVSKRSTVAFELGIDNAGGATVQCTADSTWISFSDGSASYRAILDRNQGTSIGPGANTLYFVSETIPEDIATGSYPSSVRIYGTENGLPFEEAIFPSDGIDVKDPSDLAINSITVTPLPTVTADQGREWYASMNVQNYGEASVQLDSLEMRLFNGATNVTDEVQITQIDFVPGTVLAGEEAADFLMEIRDNAVNSMTTGTVIIDASVWGLDLPSSEILTATTETGGKGSYLVQTQADLVVLDVIPAVERATVLQTKDWVIDAVIRNDGQSDIDISFDTDSTFVTFSTSGDFLVIRPTELAGGGTILEGLSTDTLRFVVDQTGSVNGNCIVNTFVGGTETSSLRLLPLVSDGTPAHVAIQSEAALVINRLTPRQDPVTLLQERPWLIEMEVENLGESNAELKLTRMDSTWVDIPAGSGFVIENPVELQGGGSTLGGLSTGFLRFNVMTTGDAVPGRHVLTGSVLAEELNSSRAVWTNLDAAASTDSVSLERRLVPEYVAGSLAPTVVSSGTSISLEIDIRSIDPWYSTLRLDHSKTTAAFGDLDDDTLRTNLSPISVDSLVGGGVTEGFLFEQGIVDTSIEYPGEYPVAIHLEGTENGNPFTADLISVPDLVKVEDAPQLNIDRIIVPQSVTVSQPGTWEIKMLVKNNGEANVKIDLDETSTRLSFVIGLDDVSGQYTVLPPTELEIAESDTLTGGETDTLTFIVTETGYTGGSMVVHGYIAGTDINSGDPLTDNTFDGGWGNMVVQASGDPIVDSTTPKRTTVTSNQTTHWDITVAVCNIGGSELTYLIDNTLIETAPIYAMPYIKPTEFDEGGTSLSAGECKHLTFTVTSTPDIPGGEDLILHSRVGFTENNSAEYLEYDTRIEEEGDGTIRVQEPADISLARVENNAHRAPNVNTDQGFPVLFEVTNSGEATAKDVVVTLGTSGSSVPDEASITIPEIIGYSTGVDSFYVTAPSSAGEETLTALIESALDANSGEGPPIVVISAPADDTALVVVQDPGKLVVTTLIPSQTEVNAGQTADWYLRAVVENRGTAPVIFDPPTSGDITFILGPQLGDYIVTAPDTFASSTYELVLNEDDIDTLIYTVATTGSDTGWVDIQATLDWKDENDTQMIQAAAYADTMVHVKTPSGLRIKLITSDAPNRDDILNISTVNTSQIFGITVRVENTGGDDIDSVQVKLEDSGTAAILNGEQNIPIPSGGEVDFVFTVTAGGTPGIEVLTASIEYAISVNTGQRILPLEALDKTENVIVQVPALLSCAASITAPPGAVNDTVAVGQEFTLTAVVVNNGTAVVDASGEVTLTLLGGMELVNPGTEPLIRPFTPGVEIPWTIRAPMSESTDDVTVEITNAPNDINIDAACSIGVGLDTVTVVTVESASIDIAEFYFESPEGAKDGVLSTEQDFTIAARFTASANCDSVRLELDLPTGFTTGDGLVQYAVAISGVEDTLRWSVTAPASVVPSETIRVIPRGWDVNSEESFTDLEETVGVQVELKAVLDLSYYISGPPEADDHILSVGLVFTVTADVLNTGDAGVDTTGARLEIVLLEGYELEPGAGETYKKPFYPDGSVTWNLQAPGSAQPTPADITVTFFAEPYATDLNTNLSATMIEDQAPISVVTEEGQLKMTNLSDIDTIPPYVVPQRAEDVPVLRVGLQNNSTYTVGLDTLYLTVERGGGQAVSDPSRYISSIELVRGQDIIPSVILIGNPVQIVVDHSFTIQQLASDTFLIRVDIAGNAPAGELRFDIAESDDIFFTISGGPRIHAVWAGDGGDIAGHFLSGPLSVMSADFEEYVHNYPNPFRAGSESTRIAYFMTEDASVSIKIYDLMGNLVFTKDIPSSEPGASGTADRTPCETEWDGRNNRGDVVRNGVYLCKIQAGSRSVTFKIAVAK